MPPYSTKQHAYLWCRINTGLTSHQQANVYFTMPLISHPPEPGWHRAPDEKTSKRMPAFVKLKLHQGTKQKKNTLLSAHWALFPNTQWERCGYFILFWFGGLWWDLKCMSRQWCQLLWGISHPNLSKVRDFYKLWWLVDDESRHVTDWQFHRPAKTLIQEEWREARPWINPMTVGFTTIETHKGIVQNFHLSLSFTLMYTVLDCCSVTLIVLPVRWSC